MKLGISPLWLSVSLLITVSTASADTFTWTNLTTAGDWTDLANWNPAAPANDGTAVLDFTGSKTESGSQTAALRQNWDIARLNFGGTNTAPTASYNLWQITNASGESFGITLRGDGGEPNIALFNDSRDPDLTGTTNHNVRHSIAGPITVATSQTWRNSGDGTVTLSGPVNAGSQTLTIDGSAPSGSDSAAFNLSSSSAPALTFATGGVLVLRRELQLAQVTDAANKSQLQEVYIAPGGKLTTPGGLAGTEIIADNATVTVEGDRGFNQFRSETVGTFYSNVGTAIRSLGQGGGNGKVSLGGEDANQAGNNSIYVNAGGTLAGTVGFGTKGSYGGFAVVLAGGATGKISPGDPRNDGLYTKNAPVSTFNLIRHNNTATNPMLDLQSGVYEWSLRSLNGSLVSAENQSSAGSNWDLIKLDFSGTGVTAENAALGFANLSSFTIRIDQIGTPANWDSEADYRWKIIDAPAHVGLFDASKFFVDASAFTLGIAEGRGFSVSFDEANSDLYVQYVAVPEPGTAMALFGGVGVLAAMRRRRH